MIILDSSALIEITRGGDKSKKILEIVSSQEIATTAITMHEFMLLARPSELEQFKEILDSILIYPYDKTCVNKSVLIEENLAREGKMINKLDIFIGAICLKTDSSIITLDKDFNRISGLKVISV